MLKVRRRKLAFNYMNINFIERMFIMKKIFTAVFLIALMLISVTSSTLFAQADTVKVSALPPGNLNNFINADTTASGALKPNRVYLIQQTAAWDTVYYITSPIVARGHVNIIGRVNPATGHPPVVAPFILEDNSSVPWFFNPSTDDSVTLRGIYFMGTRTDGVSFTGRFVNSAGDNITYTFDHCVLENISGEGTPNLFNTWEVDHQNFYITNCIFRNSQDDFPQNPGFAWVDPGNYPCDNAILRNNTFFIGAAYIFGSSNWGASYLEFTHNTIFYAGNGGAFPIPQLHNAVVKNNIFFSLSSIGSPISWGENNWGSGIFTLDSLTSLRGDPWNMTEADRNLTITNNAYFWPQVIIDKWDDITANPAILTGDSLGHPSFMIGTAVQSDAIRETGMNIINDRTTWPDVNIADNNNIDPGFDAALVEAAGSEMAAFVETYWINYTGNGYRPYVKPQTNPPTWDDVPANWQEISGYPVPENLRYSADLKGDDGLPLGDLNWYPEIISSIDDNEMPNTVPTKLTLRQNYPNPFNPTTTIEYSISNSSLVTLKVYNLLGKEVTTLVNKNQTAGDHVVEFDASNLASGVYFYNIKAENYTVTKKMLLIK